MFTLKIVDDVEAPVVEAPAVVVAPAAPVVSPALAEVLAKVEAMQARQEALLAKPVVAEVVPERIDPTDFLIDPEGSVAKVVARTMEAQAQAKVDAQARTQAATDAILKEVPNALELQKEEGFKAFIKSNPAAGKLYSQGIANVDASSVTVALQLYQARGAPEAAVDNTVVTAGVLATGTPTVGVQTFSRAALERMQATNPEQYQALNDEIMAAYADGRITA